MPEYVEKEWLLDKAEEQFKSYKPRSIPKGEALWIAKKFVIEAAPVASVTPIIESKWMSEGDDWLICLNCESEINTRNSLGVENKRNFCPCCGARMTEWERKENTDND